MNPAHWTLIAKAIQKNYNKYDGFVVVQGTDTMAYTASAVSFALQNLDKPIVFTGSVIPLNEIGSDGRNNLVYACLTATLDLAEVCMVFANKILRGNRCKKRHESFTAVFYSPLFPKLGELGRPTQLFNWRVRRGKRKLKFQPDFDSNISVLRLFPGFNPEVIDREIERKTHGIIIEGFGPGNVPFLGNSVIPQIERATEVGIPVVLANQMEKGVTNLNAYEAGYYAQKAGAISSMDMTNEATVAKLMWVLARAKSLGDVRTLMGKNLAGEMRD
jgi:L-asparaginase